MDFLPQVPFRMKKTPLRLLLAEDSDTDALLVEMALKRGGFEVDCTRVQSADEFRKALEDADFQIVLCDHAMPGFDAPTALEILAESDRDVPMIVVSGTISEQVAVEVMKAGAVDYLLKSNLTRLAPAVEREMREAEGRRQKRVLDHFSEGQTDVLAMILNGTPLATILERVIGRVQELINRPTSGAIMLVDEDSDSLTLAASRGLPEEFLERLEQVTLGAGRCGCASAAAYAKTVAADDLWEDPEWAEVREVTRKYGLRSCWSVPVFSSERKVLGTISMYHRTQHSPTNEELYWVETATNLVSLAVERSRLAEQFRANEALLQIASETAQLGGWIADFGAARVIWSDQVCEIHEVPPGTSPEFDQALDFYPPQWREKIAGAFERCLFEGVPFDEEMQIVTANGRWIWVRTIGVGIRGEDGGIKRIQGALQDITEKKLAEADTARLAARLTTTLESITDAFFTVDREWRFTYVNAKAEAILGRTAVELLGQDFRKEFPEYDDSRFGREYRRSLQDNVSIELVEYFAPRGRWYEVRAYPSAEGLAVYTHDVTEQRQAQDQLKFLENCVSRINDIVLITTPGPADEALQRIVFVNDAFVHHMGYPREEVLGLSPKFLLGQAEVGEVSAIRKALESRQPARADIVAQTKAGHEIWLEIEIMPLVDADGLMEHLVVVAREVTQRKQAEEIARAGEARYLRQRNALIALTRDTSLEGENLEVSFRRITEMAARTLEVARVSVWQFSEDRETVVCRDLYELAKDAHTSGIELTVAENPTYFEGIEREELIVADDGADDPRGMGFRGSYLAPNAILSFMDVPVHAGSRVGYLLCNEHCGSPRTWTADEKTFALAVGNLVSLALESHERARAEREVLRSHQRFQSVAAATNDTVWDWDLETDSFWWNDGFARLFGWAATEVNANIQAWIRQIHPEDRNRVVSGIYAAIGRGESMWIDEYRFISNDGSVSDVIDRSQAIRDADGKVIRMVGGMTDLTAQKASGRELARTHRALQMLSACNEMLVRTPGESDLLAEACRIAVEVGGYRMAWVGYARDDETRRIVPMAHAGEEVGYLSEIFVSWAENHASGQGPVGQAVRTGLPVVFEDVVGNPAFSYWLGPARARGYRGVISLPLRNELRTFGVLCLYTAEPNPTSKEELSLLTEMADDLVFGIENSRSRLQRQRTMEVIIKVAQAVSSGTASEFFHLLTTNMVEALNARCGLVGRYNPTDETVETLSYVVGGDRQENITYDIGGTPCGRVLGGDVFVIGSGAQQMFPEDRLLVELDATAYAGIPLLSKEGHAVGILAVFFSEPLEDTSLVRSMLQIFATRAGAELDRQQADARIREQASLLDKAQDAIVVRDLNHSITYWNKSAERLYGWSAAEAVGRSFEELLYRDPATFARAQRETLRTGEWFGEMIHMDKGGRDLIIEGRWTLVRDEQGNPQSVFVINTDISEHRRLEQQFLQAQRMESLGTLAGGIAHDLNNILAPISMAIELLRMRAPDERSSELLDTISNSAKRGANMVSQVLSFARGMDGSRIEVEPRQLILEIEAILRDTLMKNIVMEVRVSRDLWTIHGDPTQLHQVLLNLCVNAADALPDGGRISISATNLHIDATLASMNLGAKEGPHVCIEVRDTGSGIPPEIIDRIFDPFFTTKSVGKGTGLGLSTSLAIVKGHGGFIQVTSSVHQGTSFRVYLPADPDAKFLPSIVTPTVLPRGNGETILVVDDEPAIRQIARETLETFGYKVLVAANGHEALSIYTTNQQLIAVVLTDMMMPVMDGPATIRLLMEIDPTVKIIASSGITWNREMAHQAGSGVKNFLPKPYTAETLLICLQQTLAQND